MKRLTSDLSTPLDPFLRWISAERCLGWFPSCYGAFIVWHRSFQHRHGFAPIVASLQACPWLTAELVFAVPFWACTVLVETGMWRESNLLRMCGALCAAVPFGAVFFSVLSVDSGSPGVITNFGFFFFYTLLALNRACSMEWLPLR